MGRRLFNGPTADKPSGKRRRVVRELDDALKQDLLDWVDGGDEEGRIAMLDLFESMSPMDEGAIVGSSGSIDALQRKLKKRHFVDCSLKEVGSGLVKLKVGKTLPGECGEFTDRSEEHTSELQSLMRISYAVFCLKKKNHHTA